MIKTIVNNMQKRPTLPVFLVLLSVVILTYPKVPLIFFQQDEWYSFGTKILLGWDLIFYRFTEGDINHFVPLGNLISLITFYLFKLNFVGYNLIGLSIHLLNGFLLFLLGKKIFRNVLTAFLSSILFLTFSSAGELVMWPLVSLNTLSLTLGLLGWYLLIDERSLKRPLVTAFLVALLITLAVLIIEYSAGLWIFLPVVFLVNSSKLNFKKVVIFLGPLILFGLGYLFLRLPNSGVASANMSYLLTKILSTSLAYVGQLFISEPMINLLRLFTDIRPFLLAEDKLFTVNMVLGGLIILGGLILAKKTKVVFNPLVLSVALILSSAIPYLFIPGSADQFLLYPERYFYFGLAGAALFLGSLWGISKHSQYRLFRGLMIIVVSLYLLIGVGGNWQKQESLYQEGIIRKNILQTIKNDYPQLPPRTIFYLTSNKSFYGLPEDIRTSPFQSGLGQTLLVWYHSTENFPQDFFQNRFLWEITDQGYKQIRDRGFGYFYDFDFLAQTIKEQKLPLESVLAFEYDHQSNNLTNTSKQIRQRLEGFLVDKEEIDHSIWSASASSNKADIKLAFDGKQTTFWDSKLPIASPQDIIIDLKNTQILSSLQITSQSSKDQNRNGYQILLSEDKQDWQEVFYDKLYPPKDSVVNIYFVPQKAQFLNIRQIGDHQYATWVINEIKVYRAIKKINKVKFFY